MPKYDIKKPSKYQGFYLGGSESQLNAANMPFGTVSNNEKLKMGGKVKNYLGF